MRVNELLTNGEESTGNRSNQRRRDESMYEILNNVYFRSRANYMMLCDALITFLAMLNARRVLTRSSRIRHGGDERSGCALYVKQQTRT